MYINNIIAKVIRVVLNPSAITNSSVNSKAKICSGSHMTNSSIARYSYCGHNCFILDAEIGAFTSIADNCRIGGATHAMDWVSTSPVFEKGHNVINTNFADFEGLPDQHIIIGADVWLGAGVTVLSGVEIGTGAVIGAGSVVTKNIPPYEIWAGNPAQKIKDRFDEDTKKCLIGSKWWEWDEDKIRDYSKFFNEPDLFIKSLK